MNKSIKFIGIIGTNAATGIIEQNRMISLYFLSFCFIISQISLQIDIFYNYSLSKLCVFSANLIRFADIRLTMKLPGFASGSHNICRFAGQSLPFNLYPIPF